MSNPIDVIVGQNLRAIRVKNGLSQEQLADAVGVSFQQIQKYECGKNRISASRLVEMANSLGVELEEMFFGVAAKIKREETRSIAEVRREQRVTDEYAQLPPELQAAVANLVKAIFINLGNEMADRYTSEMHKLKGNEA